MATNRIAIPWFSPSEYQRLTETLAPDEPCLDYARWVEKTENEIAVIRQRGHEAYIVAINFSHFETWAESNRYRISDRSVGDFANYLVSLIHGTEYRESVVL